MYFFFILLWIIYYALTSSWAALLEDLVAVLFRTKNFIVPSWVKAVFATIILYYVFFTPVPDGEGVGCMLFRPRVFIYVGTLYYGYIGIGLIRSVFDKVSEKVRPGVSRS